MENRKPNTTCKVCKKQMYKRPFVIESYGQNVYCSKPCMYEDRKRKVICESCKEEFVGRPKQRYCSKRCSGRATRNRLGTKKGFRKQKSSNERRLFLLYEKFHFSKCMVSGCEYRKTFDVHRLIPGRDGGKYTIGNMFAICPKHHTESHRGIVVLKKLSDCELAAEETMIGDYVSRFVPV